jgi:cell division protein FtsI/penicillin-binding protein 2
MAFLFLFLSVAWAESAISQAGLPVESVDYVIADFATGQVIEEHWREPQTASPGSLLKPFTALAWGRKNGLVFPQLNCTGETCWLPGGHGQVGIVQAIAHSCNAYFRQLAISVSPAEAGFEAARLGLRAPPPSSASESLWGLRADWLVTPHEALRAYMELVQRRSEPDALIVLQGLRSAAREGTAAALAKRLPQDAYAKTGTAECAHALNADGDGFAVAVYPADAPRYAVITRVHGQTGRAAAEAAAALLQALTTR